MATMHPAGERLDSWKSIAVYLKCTERTAMRWEKERRLPVHRIPGGGRQGVYAWPSEINQWLAHKPPQDVGSTSEPSPRLHWPGKAVALLAGIAVAFLLLLGAIDGTLTIRRPFASPALGALKQITYDGAPKQGLLAHGNSIYFGEERNGRMALCALRAGTSQPRVLWSSPTQNILPEAISADGTKLLAFTDEGVEKERPIWIVPLNGGPPRRLGTISGHSAVWSPDGTRIAYAQGTKIYLSNTDGTHTSPIASLKMVPDDLKWPDAMHLRFQLIDLHTLTSSLWQMSLGNGVKASLVFSPAFASSYDWASSPVPDIGASLAVANCCSENTPIWLLRNGQLPWRRKVRTTELQSAVRNVAAIAYSISERQLFLLSDSPPRSALLRFDPHTGEFSFILPGVSGVFLNYSRDRQRVTYTRPGEETLWVSRADGSDVKQLTTTPETVELPRISPDGRWIAYMAKRPGKPWRIYLQPRDGGTPNEASRGTDSQGAPTWSPDGRFLMYGNVECMTTETCAIHKIDLATEQESTLPNSDGLTTARWSPNGAYVAALKPTAHQLVLFDMKKKTWRTLANGIDGNDVDWSPDSKYVYASCVGSAARVIRVRISDGRMETVINLARRNPSNLSEVQDAWFAVAPDSSVILREWQHSSEIFAYALRLRWLRR